MRAIWLFFTFFWTFASAQEPLKILSFNAYFVCAGPNCLLKEAPKLDERLEALATWLRSIRPDIVLLQEIWTPDQYKKLLTKSGYRYGHYYGERSDLAVLSRFPLENGQFYPLHWQAGFFEDCKRLAFTKILAGFASIELTLPSGKKIRLMNAHTLPRWPEIPGFDSPADARTPERLSGVLEALNHMHQLSRQSLPTIFAGDFNMNQISKEYAFFEKYSGLTDTQRKVAVETGLEWKDLCTYCGDNAYVKAQQGAHEGILDYIFISSGDFQIQNARILQDSGKYSDHLAVSTTLKLKNKTKGLRPTLPSAETRFPIEQHIKQASIHPLCWLSPTHWSQRALTLEFLASLPLP